MVESMPVMLDIKPYNGIMCNYDQDQVLAINSYGFDSTPPGSASTISSSSSRSCSLSSNDDNGTPPASVFVFPTLDGAMMDMKMPHLRKSMNKLGGMYTSGKPLPISIRREIVGMAETGMKACDISRQLQISHGCVSKIIAKWRSTGSFEPRRIGGSKPKKTLPEVISAVRMYKRACPSIHSLEIRKRLLADDICSDQNVPSLSSINRIIRMKLRDEVAEFEASAVRDLMAILTGPTPTSASSPEAETEEDSIEVKQEEEESNVDMDEEYSDLSPAATQQYQLEQPPTPDIAPRPAVVHCPLPIVQSNPIANYFSTANMMDLASQLFESPLIVHPSADQKRPTYHQQQHRMTDMFTVDPYDYPLGTPVFNETSNGAVIESVPIQHQEPKMMGASTGFDFEETVWSWLDQMTLPGLP